MRSASPPRLGGGSANAAEGDILNPKGHSSKWWMDEFYSGRQEIYLTPPFGLEFPADQFGDDLVVINVVGEQAKTQGIKAGMKLLRVDGKNVHGLGSSALFERCAELPHTAPVELIFASRRGDWWTKANKLVVELDPPFGMTLPHGTLEEAVLIQVNSLKSRKAGILAGMRLMHIRQGSTDIYCKDLRGEEMIELIRVLKPGVTCTITLAEYGTEAEEFAMAALKQALPMGRERAGTGEGKPKRPLSPP